MFLHSLNDSTKLVPAVCGAVNVAVAEAGSTCFAPRAQRSISSERMAFWRDSLKVRPMAMASPTDFIWTVRSGLVPGNFSKVKRGHFVTQ